MGICREVWFQGNLMRYMWPGSGLLEPALTLVNGLMKNRVGFREKIALKEAMSGRFQNLEGLIGWKVAAWLSLAAR